MKVICFHNPDEENGYLSNWALSEFTVNGITFSSMEQYMMYQKAACFKDEEIAEKILATTDVAVIKALGRQVKGYNDSYWNGVRQLLVYEGLKENDDLKKQLLDTEDSILAECAVNDRIWGIGLSMKDLNRFEPEKWRGQNLLGYALMVVRERMQGLF